MQQQMISKTMQHETRKKTKSHKFIMNASCVVFVLMTCAYDNRLLTSPFFGHILW